MRPHNPIDTSAVPWQLPLEMISEFSRPRTVRPRPRRIFADVVMRRRGCPELKEFYRNSLFVSCGFMSCGARTLYASSRTNELHHIRQSGELLEITAL